jgi:ABC-2 type transport system permease protein
VSAPVPDPVQVRAILIATLRRATRGTASAGRRGRPRGLIFLLFTYGAMGLLLGLLPFVNTDVFTFSLVIWSATFMMCGMTMVAESSTLLLDPRDNDILGHRPIHPRTLLAARALGLTALALVLGLAINLVPMITGLFARGSRSGFPLAHLATLPVMSVFCAGTVVFVYALLARLVSRRAFDAIASWTQVVISVILVVSYQLVPRLMDRLGTFRIDQAHPTLLALPPTWFAALSMVMLGVDTGPRALTLAAAAVVMTAALAWGANRFLARGYAQQVAALGEAFTPAVPARRSRPRREAPSRLGSLLTALLRDPVERGAFRLARAYLARDRDMRMRTYPSLALVVVFPVIAVLDPDRTAYFGPIMTMVMVGTLPATAMMTFKMSPHYAAADLFRYVPIHGTAAIFHGVRKAVLVLLVLPGVVASGAILWFGTSERGGLLIALPALIALPTLSLLDGLAGDYLPLSLAPTSGRQGAVHVGMMLVGLVTIALFAGVAALARTQGWFWPMVAAEVAVLGLIHPLMLRNIRVRAMSRVEA